MSKCLLLSDGEGRLLALRQTLEVHGFTAVPDPADAELFCAREAGHGLFLLGAGEGCLRALFLAERYPVDGIALIGCPLRPRAASALRRRVERELFSVVCDVLTVQPLAAAARGGYRAARRQFPAQGATGSGAGPCRSVDKLSTSARGGDFALSSAAKLRKNACALGRFVVR